MPRVFVKTLGCKVNTFDSHALENQFRQHGFDIIQSHGESDITVINTCAVTAGAEKDARYLARRYRRENPNTMIVMTGCYAQTDSAALAKLHEVDYIVPNEIKERLVELVKNRLENEKDQLGKLPSNINVVSENRQSHFKSSLTLFDRAMSTRTRAFLKIQDGCNGFCSYCLIPYARGQSRSVPKTQIIDEIKRLTDQGVYEIVLTGIHIGDYGNDLIDHQSPCHPEPFVDLLEEIIAIKDLGRIRISSLEPKELTESLLKFIHTHQTLLCDHFHLPLQSGSNRILKLMRRTYTSEQYAEKVAMAKHYFPNSCIGADVICGFPTESNQEFEETVTFIQKNNLNYLHVFPYSKRPNTMAARLAGAVDQHTIKARSKKLRDLSTVTKQQFYRSFIGKSVAVLWENDFDQLGRTIGHSRNYLEVVCSNQSRIQNRGESQVVIKGFVNEHKLLGSIVK